MGAPSSLPLRLWEEKEASPRDTEQCEGNLAYKQESFSDGSLFV
jgi:hypothetical protein